MKLPITIDSPKFEFALIGPTGSNEGVILKTKQSESELIGYANLAYNDYEIVNSYRYGSRKFNHCWSQPISFYFDKSEINVENRQFKVLMVWDDSSLSYNHREQLENQLNRVIFDVYKIAFNDNLNIDTKINNITWLISPIIFIGSQ